jgi:hypothetical protein
MQGEVLRTNASNHSLSISRGTALDVVLLILLGIAIFFPTSVNGDFERLSLERFAYLILVLSALGYRYFKISRVSLVMFLAIITLYLFFTLSSKYSEYAFGYILSLMPILILALLRVKRVPSVIWVLRLYYISVLLVFVLAYLGFIVPALAEFRVGFYSGGYEGLAERFQSKFIPVSIFVSHSYAGFFYFLILFTSCYLVSCGFSKLLNCSIVVVCLISMLSLMSGSSYFFFLYSLLFLGLMLFFSVNKSYFFVFLKILILVISVPLSIYLGIKFVPGLIDRIVGDSGNGLLSRYGEGVLKENLEYISSNPLVGIGFSYSDEFYYTDSDYILAFLKLGIAGGVIYFSYLFLFFYSSIKKNIGLFYFSFLVVAVSAFMISMPVSNFYRTTPFLLLLVLLYSATATSRNVSCSKKG